MFSYQSLLQIKKIFANNGLVSIKPIIYIAPRDFTITALSAYDKLSWQFIYISLFILKIRIIPSRCTWFAILLY